SPYLPGQTVTGTAYETSGNFGVFVAVDDRYSALIPKQELVAPVRPGEKVTSRVAKDRDDGRLTLSLREKAYLQMDKDAERLVEIMEANGGKLAFTDKASPNLIREEVGMSKNEFKRAVGRLLKEGKVDILEDSIVLREEA
ncbi:MAG: RNA-binding protein, partial [Lachnospiraceae bacterium]|nr:RNA-binding protein [Lachnospiraceae bacterium]